MPWSARALRERVVCTASQSKLCANVLSAMSRSKRIRSGSGDDPVLSIETTGAESTPNRTTLPRHVWLYIIVHRYTAASS